VSGGEAGASDLTIGSASMLWEGSTTHADWWSFATASMVPSVVRSLARLSAALRMTFTF